MSTKANKAVESQIEREMGVLMKALSSSGPIESTTKKRRRIQEEIIDESCLITRMITKAKDGVYTRTDMKSLEEIAKKAACLEVERRVHSRGVSEFKMAIPDEIKIKIGTELTSLDWDCVLADSASLNNEEIMYRLEAAAETSRLEAGMNGMRQAYLNALEKNKEAYFFGPTPTSIILSSKSGRTYENLNDYFKVSDDVNIHIDPSQTRPGVIAAAYDVDDAEICDQWRSQFQVFAKDVSDDTRTHAAFVLDRLKDQVYARACADTSGTSPEPLIPGIDLAEVSAVGVDCYTRQAVYIALDFVRQVFADPSMEAIGGKAEFTRSILLPKMITLPPNESRTIPASLTTAAVQVFIDPNASLEIKKGAAAIITAIKFLGSDKAFKVRPKGTAVFALRPIPAHTFICDYLGETYAPARWLEKLACAKMLGQNHKEEFHNIAMEAPKTDPGGYALYFVDAGGHRANFASSLSHSCQGNVSSSLFVKDDGRLAVALHANRQIQTGEELAYDYSACTTNEAEWRSAICLCAAPTCRGSFVELVNLQELRSCFDRAYSQLDGLRALLDGCVYNHKSLPQIAQIKLDRHGFKSHFFGFHKDGGPVWLRRFVVTLIDALEFERGQLPFVLVARATEATRDRAADRARLVLEQRVQSLACAVSVANRLNINNQAPLQIILGNAAIAMTAGGILHRLATAAAAHPDTIWASLITEKCKANDFVDLRAKLLDIRDALLRLEAEKDIDNKPTRRSKKKINTTSLRACADAILLAVHTKTVVAVERREEIISEPIVTLSGETAQRKYGPFAQVEAALRWHDVDDLGDPSLGSGKLLARDLAGAALLPDPAAILLAEYHNNSISNNSKSKKKSDTQRYSSDTLAALVTDPERRTRSWLGDDCLRETFLFADADFGDSHYVDFLGSPILDAVLGDNSSLDAVVAALCPKSFPKKKQESPPKSPNGIHALADALPDRAPSHWVACDQCGKWRAVPWHHASEYDEADASFICTDQKQWGVEDANCDEPEAFFGNDDIVVASNEVLDEECTSKGSRIDALCIKTNVWFDSRIVDTRPLSDAESKQNDTNNQLSPCRVQNAFGLAPLSPPPVATEPNRQIQPKKVRIHFNNWAARYDEWFILPRDLNRLAPHRTFSTVNEEAQNRARGFKKSKKSRKRSRSTFSAATTS